MDETRSETGRLLGSIVGAPGIWPPPAIFACWSVAEAAKQPNTTGLVTIGREKGGLNHWLYAKADWSSSLTFSSYNSGCDAIVCIGLHTVPLTVKKYEIFNMPLQVIIIVIFNWIQISYKFFSLFFFNEFSVPPGSCDRNNHANSTNPHEYCMTL